MSSHGQPDFLGGGPPAGVTTGDLSAARLGQKNQVIAHALLACVTFAFIFPVGGILIRLPLPYYIHSALQSLGFIFYLAAFALGMDMATNTDLMHRTHVQLGIVILVLTILQPVLGIWHHLQFKRTGRRVVVSHFHLWIGRAVIALGIVNGGLGLDLARDLRTVAPSRGALVGYSVAAALMWLVYVAVAVMGETRRKRETGGQRRRERNLGRV
ncbi:hypothetical protein K470DRAFT_260133 [Piedraia hortae CBS 480.64]|uniref:Cytochrome b561 domain-containing protein n=1 Tax=Piedraia hortae CBS 480.64 TaxID=1314780 RepID=A0A6A7BSC3_9PEZI|nr:hypothetical protein K470DRAFT_260133 [Piedraia hortae CBS 480.64]